MLSKEKERAMEEIMPASIANRRRFLRGFLTAGTALCLGRRQLLALAAGGELQKDAGSEHKFQVDSEMTFEGVFRFAFQNYYIPTLQSLADEIGRGPFLEMLKRLRSQSAADNTRKSVEKLPRNDFSTFVGLSKLRKNRFVQHVLTDEVVEQTENYVHSKITECLWAKVFREANAADIGYAAVCHPDFATASAFNPKIKLVRRSTLMEGSECCDFRYYWEG
jgi:hypothetical protein